MDIVKPPKTIWFFSDPHFDHASLVHGHPNGGPPSRPQFQTVARMNEALIDNHNEVVRPHDHWYCLGDVAMHTDSLHWLGRLNGHGRLLLGNHDNAVVQEYLKYVKKVMAYREFDGMFFSHVPIAPWSMRWRANVHGHCHTAKPLFYEVSDPDVIGFGAKAKYINISAEHMQYRPIPLEQLSQWSRR